MNISIQKLYPTDTKLLAHIYQAYCTAFPEDERRNESQYLSLLTHPKAGIYALYNAKDFIGYLIMWHLSTFVFIEHFEIFPSFRGQNLGSSVLISLNSSFGTTVLESEPPQLSTIAQKRINFYKKNGFYIIDKHYMQPAYDISKQALHLYLLANRPIENPLSLINEIKTIVYQV